MSNVPELPLKNMVEFNQLENDLKDDTTRIILVSTNYSIYF